MNLFSKIKQIGLLLVMVSFLAGCAGTPPEETETPEAVAAQAISDAKDAAAKADAEGYLWRDTQAMIEEAEAAYKAGDYGKATQLANKARAQAENALAQKLSEEARMGEGESAATTESASDSYTVERGDSLWGISAMDSIYGNPYQWPLIYKANRDQINDADLIYPGQVFTITRGDSQEDIDAAVEHARTRGAWSLGVVEESDKAYLAQ